MNSMEYSVTRKTNGLSDVSVNLGGFCTLVKNLDWDQYEALVYVLSKLGVSEVL